MLALAGPSLILSILSLTPKLFISEVISAHVLCTPCHVSTVCANGQGIQAPVNWLARHMGSLLQKELVACSGGERAL